MSNLANPAAAFRWWRIPADGVGLARMEFVVQGSRPVNREATSRSDSQLHLDHRQGVAWTPGHLGACARQRDGQGAYPLQNTGPRPSLTKHDIGRILASNVYDPAQPVQGIQLLLVSVAVS
jgi:hypothetical protein